MTKTTLKVTGMTCGHCVRSVSEAIGGLEGVESADVQLEGGRATVVYDASKVTPLDMVGAVREEGYTAEEVSG
jgi:copper chaperone